MTSSAVNRRLHGSTTDVAIKDSWRTPPQLFSALNKIFNFSLDAAASDDHHLCPLYFTAKSDALAQSWAQFIKENGGQSPTAWCNPPFSNMGGFIDSVIQQAREGVTTVLIANWDHSAEWCQKAIDSASEVWLLTGYHDDRGRWRSGRVRFVHPETGEPAKDQPKPQALFIFRGGSLMNRPATIIPVPLCQVWDEEAVNYPVFENNEAATPAATDVPLEHLNQLAS